MKFYEYLKEEIKLPIEVGDVVLGGRFKNKKVVVKSIEQDENGNVIINGKKSLLKYRLIKKEKKDEI